MRIGIEVGGTFTDLVAVDRHGRITVAKVPSTPSSPDIGALNAIETAGINLPDVGDLVHGSTVATNAVLERKGAPICLFVSAGTRDVLLLQRHDRSFIYDLHYKKPEHVVSRRDTFEVEERIAGDGTVTTALDEGRAVEIVDQALSNGGPYQSVAICLLNSYINPSHEKMLARLIAEKFPDLVITCSHDVSREFREYERASTTALAAYVQPVIESYLKRFVVALSRRDYDGKFSIMQSNGGRMPAEAMARNAIAALFSGPAAGVVGASRQVRLAGYDDIITLDMGGTSTDVSLIVGGVPELSAMTKIDGLPIKTPVIDIVTVGAGGGSIAWVDDGGLLRVGPQSAGADPGPACYLRGGSLPTVTDAHLIRGTLQADTFLGGDMNVDREAALTAFSKLAGETGIDVSELAISTIELAVANMVRAIQQVSTERGLDPRDYVLVPYGGAGPLHAAQVAEDLEITTVVVPPHAGVLSAAGLLMSDYVHYRSQTQKIHLDDGTIAVIKKTLEKLKTEAREYLAQIGIAEDPDFDVTLEMRYRGQAFEISVPLSESELATLDRKSLAESFAAQHQKIFEFSKPPGEAVEVVSFRVGARVPPSSGLTLQQDGEAGNETCTLKILDRKGEPVDCGVTNRSALSGTAIPGPLIIEDGTSTIFVPPNWTTLKDKMGNVILSKEL